MKKIKVGSDFSGVGSFDQALRRLGIEYENVFSCDMDKYARQTYALNFGEPKYYPLDVYEREIPNDPLDVYMTSPPCQAFSLAGSRKGEEDKRGVLFYNSHEFIKKNKPRYFIFENVKGLLSDDKGKTFQRWIDYLGGKSVNGNPVIFPHEESVPYHVYYKVLNAKNYGIPQNRERVFIIGIRDDSDNNFDFPKEIELEKRLKDVLENEVDKKYFLSDKMIDGFVNKKGGFADTFKPKSEHDLIANCITTNAGNRITDNYINVGYINQDTQASQVYSENGIGQTLCTGTHGYANGYIKIGAIRGRNPENPKSRKSGLETEQMLEINENGTSNCLTTVYKDNVVVVRSATKKGFEIATPGDSINLEHPNSETRRGRVGVGVGQTLTTSCNQGVYDGVKIRKLTPLECFRLMDFNDNFKWNVSDSKAYKQAGNSICVGVLAELLKKLNIKK